MKKYPLIYACWCVINILLLVSLGAVAFSSAWEFSTQDYLKGFSDAIIPSGDKPEQKVEAILSWMAHGPARRSVEESGLLVDRNPVETLNVQQLLQVCGTASNAFMNLAQSSGLRARRLLLLDTTGSAKHVVVEVLIGSRWVIVDPAYRSFIRLPNGRLLTRTELQNPVIFSAATEAIPGYPQNYSYERTVHVRLRRIPMIGGALRKILNFAWPEWEESINWTLLVERESFTMVTVSTLVLFSALAARLFLGWYCSRRLGLNRMRLRDQIVRAGEVLVGNSG